MIIAICGEEGSGKSSLGRALAEKLGYSFYSMGDIRKKYATSHGMTLEQLNDLRKTDTTSDKMVDEYQRHLGESETNFIVDSRLGWFFIPKSVKIYVVADITERARRVFEDIQKGKRNFEPFNSVDEVAASFRKRTASDMEIYDRLYHINPYDRKHYDLVVDTTEMHHEQKVRHVVDWLKKRKLISQDVV